jgi:hypothetical protein
MDSSVSLMLGREKKRILFFQQSYQPNGSCPFRILKAYPQKVITEARRDHRDP